MSDVSIYHPKTVALATVLTTGALGSYAFYQRRLKRIPTALDIPTHVLRKRYLHGRVTSVGDGDNFHFYHTPGGVFAGWGWLRTVPTTRKDLRGQTWSVRICGVDAPECSHFGKPAQPHSKESLQWLRNYIMGHRCLVKPLRIDQYNRVVSKVLVRKWGFFKKDLTAEMIRQGMGIVYEGKSGSEFDGREDEYRRLEKDAKRKKIGLWGVMKETPGEYKRKHK